MEKNLYLEQERLTKLLFKFSVPCILSLLISSLYNIVDQIFIGNSELGYLGNAATGVVFPTLIIAQAFAWCIGDGTAAYLSLCQGKKDTKNSHSCVGTSITVTFILGMALVLIFLLLKNPLLNLLYDRNGLYLLCYSNPILSSLYANEYAEFGDKS